LIVLRPLAAINFSQTLIDRKAVQPIVPPGWSRYENRDYKGTPLRRKGKTMFNPIHIGIDVSHKSAEVGAIDTMGEQIDAIESFSNNLNGGQKIENHIASIAEKHRASPLLIATEATAFYDWHLLEFLSQSSLLASYSPGIYRLNPKWVKSFKEIDSPKDKTDENDAISIAQRLRFRQPEHPFNACMDYIPLQRLTRFRTHLAKQIASEKNYFLSHLFLKFSAYKQRKPFSDAFGATSQAVISEFFSVEQLAETPVEHLLQFVIKHGKNRSYRIRPELSESVNLVLATTLNNIRALNASKKEVNAAIEKAYNGFSLTLDTIPGIGIIFAAGIFAEIGDIERFASEAQLARYAGLAWKRSQSGDFSADETPIFRSSNVHLRYYLVEAANSVKNNEPAYSEYYQKKYNEVKKHQHKRALVLTARKLVRLIYSLLKKGEIYKR
jgi:transposase